MNKMKPTPDINPQIIAAIGVPRPTVPGDAMIPIAVAKKPIKPPIHIISPIMQVNFEISILFVTSSWVLNVWYD
jgi:hypothetical protein